MAGDTTSRRELLGGLGVAVVAAVAGFAAARSSSLKTPQKAATSGANGYGPTASGTGQFLANLSAVPAGGGLILQQQLIVLVNEGSDEIRGFSAVCTHQGCTVAS